jgi:hypothetical protein
MILVGLSEEDYRGKRSASLLLEWCRSAIPLITLASKPMFILMGVKLSVSGWRDLYDAA